MKKRTMITVGLLVLLLCIVGAIAGIYLFHSQEKQENPDAYAWISIPGTDIDAPVMQHSKDNSFYATHDADGEENPVGALYTENYNHTNFDDPLTVIYGNDNQDGSMFGGLYQYADDAYMKEHAWIYITFDNAEKLSVEDQHLVLPQGMDTGRSFDALGGQVNFSFYTYLPE